MISRFVYVCAVCVFIAAPVTGHAVTLQVNCDQQTSKLPTINSALKVLSGPLGSLGSNIVQVTGACNENIVVTAMANLTLTATGGGASITDASRGTKPVLDISQTTNFSLNGFAIRGGGDPRTFNSAIACERDSTCYLSHNNVQHTNGLAIAVTLGSSMWLDHDVLEQSASGILVAATARLTTTGAIIRNNTGFGANIVTNSFGLITGSSTIQNNGGFAVQAYGHSFVQISDSTITGNGGPGVLAQSSSEAFFTTGTTISGNAAGVSLGALSMADFFSSIAVSGNTAQPDINCWGKFSTASPNAATIGTTNCLQ
jgi:hypothetical protein